ncbi:MAG: hypothetical protein WBG92_21095 [Thiohalocapsa sp.]
MLPSAADAARWRAQNSFIASLRQSVCGLCAIGDEYLPRAEALMQDNSDLPMDLTGALLVMLAVHFGRGRILSTDEAGLPDLSLETAWAVREPDLNCSQRLSRPLCAFGSARIASAKLRVAPYGLGYC